MRARIISAIVVGLMTITVGIVAALIGTAIARGAGLADTAGVDWVEILNQVALAALGVALVSGFSGRRSVT